MASKIYFKWASQEVGPIGEVAFTGQAIRLADLKAEIMQLVSGGNAEFDLEVRDSEKDRVITDELALIPKNSTVVISRIPLASSRIASSRPHWNAMPNGAGLQVKLERATSLDDFQDVFTSSSVQTETSQKPKPTIQNDDSAAIQAYVQDTGQLQHIPSTGARTALKGFTRFAAKNDVPSAQPRVKKAIGIPKNLLTTDEGHTSGDRLQMKADEDSFGQKMKGQSTNDIQFDEIEKKIANFPGIVIPGELLCRLSGTLLKDAVRLPCCLQSCSFEKINDALISSGLVCPLCGRSGISPDTLKVDKILRDKVNAFVHEAKIAIDKAGETSISNSPSGQTSAKAVEKTSLEAIDKHDEEIKPTGGVKELGPMNDFKSAVNVQESRSTLPAGGSIIAPFQPWVMPPRPFMGMGYGSWRGPPGSFPPPIPEAWGFVPRGVARPPIHPRGLSWQASFDPGIPAGNADEPQDRFLERSPGEGETVQNGKAAGSVQDRKTSNERVNVPVERRRDLANDKATAESSYSHSEKSNVRKRSRSPSRRRFESNRREREPRAASPKDSRHERRDVSTRERREDRGSRNYRERRRSRSRDSHRALRDRGAKIGTGRHRGRSEDNYKHNVDDSYDRERRRNGDDPQRTQVHPRQSDESRGYSSRRSLEEPALSRSNPSNDSDNRERTGLTSPKPRKQEPPEERAKNSRKGESSSLRVNVKNVEDRDRGSGSREPTAKIRSRTGENRESAQLGRVDDHERERTTADDTARAVGGSRSLAPSSAESINPTESKKSTEPKNQLDDVSRRRLEEERKLEQRRARFGDSLINDAAKRFGTAPTVPAAVEKSTLDDETSSSATESSKAERKGSRKKKRDKRRKNAEEKTRKREKRRKKD